MPMPAAPATRRALWRSRAIRAIACVVLGAVTTVGAAWWAAFALPQVAADQRLWTIEKDGQAWMLMFAEQRGPVRRVWARSRPNMPMAYEDGIYRLEQGARSPTRADLDAVHRTTLEQLPDTPVMETAFAESHGIDWAPSPPAGAQCIALASGWPAPAVRGWLMTGPATGPNATEEHGTILLQDKKRALPYYPLLPGFLLDTLLYAVPWWIVLATPGFVRRWRRKRRGACLACGYDLRGLHGSVVCPECGT